MKFTLIIILCFFCGIEIPAQEILWENAKYFNTDSAARVGGYGSTAWWENDKIIVYASAGKAGNFLDIYNINGDFIRTINGVVADAHYVGGLIRRKNHRIAYYNQINSAPPSSRSNFLIQELTPEGDTLQRHTYHVTNGGNIALNLIEDTLNNSIVASGWSTTLNSAPFLSVLRTDSNLAQLWFKIYPKIGIDTVIYSINMVINSKGNYVASGTFSITSKKFEHPYFVEIKPSGDTVRTKIIIVRNKNVREDAYVNNKALVYTADKGYLFLAAIDTFMSNMNIPDQVTAVVKLDSNFNTQWVQYLTAGKNFLQPANAIEMADSTYLVCSLESESLGGYFRQTTFFKISKEGELLSRWNLNSKICTSYNYGFMFLPNDSSLVFTGVCEKGCYIARIGGVGNPMHPDPRPAPYIAPLEPVYTIPNLITPNNDGQNETFEILSNQIPAMGVQLKIYNRWGSQVYTSQNYQHNWAADGLADGVYYYQAEVKDKKYKGWVQVVR